MCLPAILRSCAAPLLLLGLVLACSAKNPKPSKDASGFLEHNFFSYGMALQDAEELVKDPKKWQTVFGIDTPSTTDIAVVYQRQYFWRVSFYNGKCYSLEQRGEVEPEVVENSFKTLGELHGETHEATRSEDGGLIYSRWRLASREISLTASLEGDGRYRVTYEEADPALLSTARRKQELELGAAPGDVDPITGKPRLRKPLPGELAHPEKAEKEGQGAEDKDTGSKDGETQPAPGDEVQPEDAGDDADPKAEDKAKEDKAKDDKAKKDEDSGINDDDPDEW